MTDFVMPVFSAQNQKDANYLNLMFALGYMSEDVPSVTLKMAEKTFAEQMPEFIVDDEQFAVNDDNRNIALFIFGMFKQYMQTRFWLVSGDEVTDPRANFLDYCGVSSRELLLNPRRFPLILRVLREKAELEVVVRQFAGAHT